jgi:FkbM family methyltransferase
MKNSLKSVFYFCALQGRLLSPGLASRIHSFGGSPHDFCRNGAGVILRDVGIPVDGVNAGFLARAGGEMRALKAGIGAQWKPAAQGKFEARIGDLNFEVSSAEDVFVLSEVFGLGVYALGYPGRSIVIDIGANIGASALYFASKTWAQRVYAFEPLKPTAQVAKANFARNPSIQEKITLFEYGLSSQDETLTVEYSPEWKGKSGPQSLPKDLPRSVESWKEQIQLRGVSQVFPEILGSAGDCAVILKMDCEGGEWKILPELARSGLLKRIHFMVFEWHERTPEPLEKLLIENNFSVVRRTDLINAPIGLIYATNLGGRA